MNKLKEIVITKLEKNHAKKNDSKEEEKNSLEQNNENVLIHTPVSKGRTLQYKKEIHNRDLEWRSCCFSVDGKMCVFLVHTISLLCIIAYSAIALSQKTDCHDKNIWQSILTMCIGLLIPTPQMK